MIEDDMQLSGSASKEERERIQKLGVRVIPPDPTPLVNPVDVPTPKPIDPALSEPERAALLAQIYREVGKSRFKCEFYAYATGEPHEWAGYKQMAEAANMLCRRGIPPEAWCLVSFDIFREVTKFGGPPKPLWVWNPERIGRNALLFEGAQFPYSTDRRVLCPQHLYLVYDWRRMWAEILRQKPKLRVELEALVEQVFPGTSYEDRVVKAQAEQAWMQRAVNDNEGAMCLIVPEVR